ncbi:MAG: FkbM family methyltransferase [Planctomycetota bacterium]|jgi:FkbM family methyltransferase|nr:FkbM family methyltransferase [Planctomycetota bacterium]MDP6518999.1 FkbM family methyltransferase [Planctomycetota bacterium]MDP6839462.1 FkbM family methyltransferase [Planctomycetota bacterium]MDP6954637.1 FkbM family methyltransferase [Planctomycetota bacterium]
MHKAPSHAEWERKHQQKVAEDVAQALPYLPEEKPVLIDVGANYGLFTAAILRSRPDARAFLFEPVPEVFEKCRERFKDNPNVTVENFGLGDVQERVTIWKSQQNPGGNSMVRKLVDVVDAYTDFETEEVEVRVFSDYAREKGLEQAHFVKIDAEGYDYKVLWGMLPFLTACNPRPGVLAELLEKGLHHDWERQEGACRALFDLGYEEVDLKCMARIDDILFVPTSGAPAS